MTQPVCTSQDSTHTAVEEPLGFHLWQSGAAKFSVVHSIMLIFNIFFFLSPLYIYQTTHTKNTHTTMFQNNFGCQVNDVMTLFSVVVESTLQPAALCLQAIFFSLFKLIFHQTHFIIFFSFSLTLIQYSSMMGCMFCLSASSSSSLHAAGRVRHHHHPAVATCVRGISNVTTPHWSIVTQRPMRERCSQSRLLPTWTTCCLMKSSF